MTNINLNSAYDLSKLADRAKKDAQEEAEAKAIVGDATDAEKALQLPEPKGYRILCAIPSVEDTYSGGILKADQTRSIEEHSTVVLFVLKLGDLAYKDETRFPTGPWCKEGDFILTRAYVGTRFKIHGREFRLLNDDSVEGVVQDPRGYSRA